MIEETTYLPTRKKRDTKVSQKENIGWNFLLNVLLTGIIYIYIYIYICIYIYIYIYIYHVYVL